MFRLIQAGQRYVDRNGAAITVLATNARSIKFQWDGAQGPVQASYGKFIRSFEVLTEQDSEILRLGIGITYPEVTAITPDRLYTTESARRDQAVH